MNKTELVEKIAAGAGLSKVDAKKALDATVAAILPRRRLRLLLRRWLSLRLVLNSQRLCNLFVVNKNVKADVLNGAAAFCF